VIDLDSLPATMTAADINKYLRRCTAETLREALKQGKIKGKRLNDKRILYQTRSVLIWLGLIESEEISDVGHATPKAVTHRKGAAR
jgi:hypothetical protein